MGSFVMEKQTIGKTQTFMDLWYGLLKLPLLAGVSEYRAESSSI